MQMAPKSRTSIKDHSWLALRKINSARERINQKIKRGCPMDSPISCSPIIAKNQPKIKPVVTLEIRVANFIKYIDLFKNLSS